MTKTLRFLQEVCRFAGPRIETTALPTVRNPHPLLSPNYRLTQLPVPYPSSRYSAGGDLKGNKINFLPQLQIPFRMGRCRPMSLVWWRG